MKAWIVREKDESRATVVFAESRGKARALAQHTECCKYVDFCDIEAKRAPQVDKYYKDGKKELDWFNSKDRIILCKECGFVCEDTCIEECKECWAKEYCDYYLDNCNEDCEED